jgi:hypothetical protein
VWLVTGFHRSGPGSWTGSMWGLWWTKRHWGRFFPSTSVSSGNHSTNPSIIIITWGWHNRPLVAGMPSGPNRTPPPPLEQLNKIHSHSQTTQHYIAYCINGNVNAKVVYHSACLLLCPQLDYIWKWRHYATPKYQWPSTRVLCVTSQSNALHSQHFENIKPMNLNNLYWYQTPVIFTLT